MTTFFPDLRHWIYRLKKRVSRPSGKKYTLIPGLPESISEKTLSEVVRENFNCSISAVSHIHLSGWKSTGAYRLIIKRSTGSDLSLIFKNASYVLDDIPALKNLPIHPGLPEYIVYSQNIAPLAQYLPVVYLINEVHPGTQYHYILEDLQAGFRIIKSDEDRQHISNLLPALYEAMTEWQKNADLNGFLKYGQEFSKELEIYAYSNLVHYQNRFYDKTLERILGSWAEITQIHLNPEFFPETSIPIHGDSNFSNIHLSRKDPSLIKLVDWEWAGFGTPYADLTSLLKGTYSGLEKIAFETFFKSFQAKCPSLNYPQNMRDALRLYHWSGLERGMLDASFLAAQFTDQNGEARINLPKTISLSLQRMWDHYQQLTSDTR